MGLGALLLSRTIGWLGGTPKPSSLPPFARPFPYSSAKCSVRWWGSMPENEGEGARWVKSSASFSNGACVEVADLPNRVVGVRHSKDPEGPVLKFTPAEWHAFLGGARLGEFDSFGA